MNDAVRFTSYNSHKSLGVLKKTQNKDLCGHSSGLKFYFYGIFLNYILRFVYSLTFYVLDIVLAFRFAFGYRVRIRRYPVKFNLTVIAVWFTHIQMYYLCVLSVRVFVCGHFAYIEFTFRSVICTKLLIRLYRD